MKVLVNKAMSLVGLKIPKVNLEILEMRLESSEILNNSMVSLEILVMSSDTEDMTKIKIMEAVKSKETTKRTKKIILMKMRETLMKKKRIMVFLNK